METDESKRITAFEMQELSYFKRLMEKSPLRKVDSPTIEKKFSSASQKYVGTSNSISNNHIVQKHNYLLNTMEDPIENKLNKYHNKKSASPLNDTRNMHRKN